MAPDPLPLITLKMSTLRDSVGEVGEEIEQARRELSEDYDRDPRLALLAKAVQDLEHACGTIGEAVTQLAAADGFRVFMELGFRP